MKKKQELIDAIVEKPLGFSEEDFIQLVNIGTEDEFKHQDLELDFDDLRKMLIRIFDINETSLKEESDATTGVLGFLNKRSTTIRHKRYYKLIDKGFRTLKNETKKVIVAEGDSWFQFPVFIKDIFDWLSDEKRYAVYSIAYGGDWFANILYDEKYIEELSIHRPDVFLISAGGNDFIGSNRLAVVVNGEGVCPNRHFGKIHEQLIALEKRPQQFTAQLEVGYKRILPSFYSFLWIIKAQYYKLFHKLRKSGKFDKMKILTQGYDYAVPTFKRRTKKWYSLQPLVNSFAGSGYWLKRPLMIQGVKSDYIGRCIIKALIFEINCLFTDLATSYNFSNVYHIDCRGTAQCDDDWWDEIHLHSEGFKKIADAFKYCIDNHLEEKVVRVVSV